MYPLLFEVGTVGTPCVLSPYFFGSRHCLLFEELLILTVTPCIGVHCRNFHEIYSQLILKKIIKIVATRCQILRLKFTKFISAGALPIDPAGELTALPETSSWI